MPIDSLLIVIGFIGVVLLLISTSETVPNSSGLTASEQLNDIARLYYLVIYGDGILPVWFRRIRLLLVLIAALNASLFLGGYVRAFWAPHIHFELGRMFTGMSSAMLASAVVPYTWALLSLQARYSRGMAVTGARSWREVRRRTADAMTAGLDGPAGFLHMAEQVMGPVPKPLTALYEPYRADSGRRLALNVAVPVVLVLLACLGDFALARMLPHLLARPPFTDFMIGGAIVLSVAGILAAWYFVLLMLSATPQWKSIHIGPRYFPLQVFCRDIREQMIENCGPETS